MGPHPVMRLPRACPGCNRRSACRRRASEFVALTLARRLPFEPSPLAGEPQLCGHGSNGCLTHHRPRRLKKRQRRVASTAPCVEQRKSSFVRQSTIFRTVPGRRRELNAWESGRQWDRRPLRCAFLTQKKRVASRIYAQHRCILTKASCRPASGAATGRRVRLAANLQAIVVSGPSMRVVWRVRVHQE